MNKLISIPLLLALFVAIVFIPISTHAQAMQDQGGNSYSDQNTTNTSGNNTPGMTNGTNQTNDTGFNLWWLLPLIALPLLYLALRQGSRSDETRTYQSQGSIAGAKGGRSRSDITDEE